MSNIVVLGNVYTPCPGRITTSSWAPGASDPALTPKQSKEALTVRLIELAKVDPIMLFMKGIPKSPVCRFSRRIVRILNDRGIVYDSFNVLTDEDVRQGLKEFADWLTFPQLCE
ncbi:hypothetical protein DER46DRAFT_582141 [Fusarium sp. MPI-SDFR-AT-0072]|nr:hypothetical protein DER46DRAFT_582141 [Fusarium sp. MPI-SDFR-AT-0072]